MLQRLGKSSSKPLTPAWPIGAVLLAFAAAIVLPVLGCALVALLALDHSDRTHRIQKLEMVAGNVADDLNDALSRIAEKLQLLATSPALPNGDYAAFYAEAKAAAARLEGGRIVVVNPAMQETVHTLMPPGSPLPMLPDGGLARNALEQGQVRISDLVMGSDAVNGPGATSWMFEIAVPSVADGQAHHVLLAYPTAGYLETLLKSLVPPHWSARLVDGRGLIMARAGSQDDELPTLETTRKLMPGWQLAIAAPDQPGNPLLRWGPWMWLLGGAGTVLLAGWTAAKLGRKLIEPMQSVAQAATLVGRGQILPLQPSQLLEANSVFEALNNASVQIAQRTRALKSARDEARRRAREAEQARDEARRRAREAEEAKSLLDTLLENVPDGITIVSGPPDFSVVATSRSSLELLGGSDPSLMKLTGEPSGLKIYHKDGHTPARRHELPLHRACYAGESVRDQEWIIELPDGDRIVCAMNAVPIRDKSGALIGAVNCWRDVTLRTKEEARLREAMALANAVNEGTRALIYVKDQFGRLTSANPALLQVTGKSEQEVLGKSHPELFGDTADARQVVANDRKVIETGCTLEFEERIDRPEGSRHYLSTKSPVLDPSGEAVALVGVSVDITDRKRSESAAKLLVEIDHDLSQLSSSREMITRALNRLGAFLQASRCNLAIVGDDGDSLTIEPGWLNGTASVDGTHSILPIMTPELRAALATPEIFAIADVATDPRTSARSTLYTSADIGAFIVKPIAEGGRIRAYLAAHARAPREWQADEVHLLHEVASRVWSARSRSLTEAALRTSEERYRLAAQAMQGLIYDWDLTTDKVQRSSGLQALLGFKPEDVPDTHAWWRERCHPDDLESVSASEKAAITERRTHSICQYRIRHRDGHWVHVADRGHIVYAAEGTPLRWVGSTVDITGQVHAEVRLRESEERSRALVEASAQTVWTTNAGGEVEEDSPSWRAFTGQTLLQFLGWGWLDALHPQDRARSAETWRRAMANERFFSMEYRLRHRTGEWRWMQARAVPLLTPDRGVRAWVCMTSDITDRRKWEEQQRLLLSELSHRVKNVLAVVQAMATRTLSGGRSLAEAGEVLTKRLHALSRAHDMLTTRDWQGAPLRAIVQGEFTPFAGRARIDGPDLMIGPRMAQTLALVLHELATNAVKYGALSNADGQVSVKWSVEGEGEAAQFKFQWRERGGPEVKAPARKGFGTALLNMAISGNPDSPSPVRFEANGLVYEIDVPLSSVT